MTAAEALTWRKRGNAFTFDLEMPSGDRPSKAMARWTRWMFDRVPGIGRVNSVALATAQHGEDAFVWTLDALDADTIVRTIDGRSDASQVEMQCDLVCSDIDDTKIEIAGGLTAYLQVASFDAPAAIAPLEITLMVHADIYAATSWADDRDNHKLAARNAPVFNRFLVELQEAMHATMTEVSSDGYRGQVDRTGFVTS